MPTMIPDKIAKSQPLAEILIFNALKASSGAKTWTVVHSWKISKAVANIHAEVDFVVLIPNKGIVLIEAKGAKSVTLDEHGWLMEDLAEDAKRRDPFDQVIAAERNLRAELRKLDLENRKIPISRLVWFPKMGSEKASLAEVHGGTAFKDYEIAFANSLNNPFKLIEDNLALTQVDQSENSTLSPDSNTFTKEVSDRLVKHLTGSLDVKQTVVEKRAARKRELNKVLQEQSQILQLVGDNTKMYVTGPAGSGKSYILSDLAKRASKQGHRVLVTCHNIMMADNLQLELSLLPNVKVINLNDLMLEISGVKEHKTDGDKDIWFDQTLPRLALAKLHKGPTETYSTIVVDEFQDLAPSPDRMAVLKLLLGEARGLESRIYLAGDDGQQILHKGEVVPSLNVAENTFGYLAKVKLNQNIRQSPSLSAAIYRLLNRTSPFQTHRIHAEFDDGLEVISVTPENQTKRLEAVLRRLEKDYALTDIRVLCFDKQRAALARLFENLGNLHSAADRWLVKNCKHDTNPGGLVRWRSIRQFKGLDQDVIIITDVSNESAEWSLRVAGKPIEDLLYVGMTRARFKVILMVQDNLYPATHQSDGSRFVNKSK